MDIIFLFCQLFSGARSTWLGSQPWNTAMSVRENGHQWVLLRRFRNIYASSKKCIFCSCKTESKQMFWNRWIWCFSHTEFSLSAYKRNKRKMELAEKLDTGHNQTKKRRQSSENVSSMLSFWIRWHQVYDITCVRMEPPLTTIWPRALFVPNKMLSTGSL